jgi:hypothetical protein
MFFIRKIVLKPKAHFNVPPAAHNAFMCFAWISEQTAIIFLCSINLPVFITETECLLRGTNWVFNQTAVV